MNTEHEELKQKIIDYIYKRYNSYIKEEIIRYGKASFTVDMLVEGSIETYTSHRNYDLFYIVDYMFDYYCI